MLSLVVLWLVFAALVHNDDSHVHCPGSSADERYVVGKTDVASGSTRVFLSNYSYIFVIVAVSVPLYNGQDTFWAGCMSIHIGTDAVYAT